MADQVKYPGRLIAVDGSRGKDVAVAAGDIVAALKRDGIECAVSRWDASGLFTDLAAGGRGDRNVSIRTLSLVYAADLAFRLRWEIRPVLEAGGVVMAAPYIDTAVALRHDLRSRRGMAALADAVCAGSGFSRPRARSARSTSRGNAAPIAAMPNMAR